MGTSRQLFGKIADTLSIGILNSHPSRAQEQTETPQTRCGRQKGVDDTVLISYIMEERILEGINVS